MVLASYLLAPYREKAGDLPDPVYPYFGAAVDPDDEYAYFLELAERH